MHSRSTALGRVSGNLGRLREGRVRFQSCIRTDRKIVSSGLAGLAVERQYRYISRNLWFSYDRVLRVGPSGPALFYYLSASDENNGAGWLGQLTGAS
jgi:hypothetical protein